MSPLLELVAAAENTPAASVTRDLTDLLQSWRGGDEEAADLIFRRAYPHLREIAQNLSRTHGDHVLQVTELVNEAFLKLNASRRLDWRDRTHFFATAVRVVRQVIVDEHRRRQTLKRGGDRHQIPIDAPELAREGPSVDLVALHSALERLDEADEQAARVVDLRFFGGLTIEETAEALGLGRATVVVIWRHTRAWLRREMSAHG